MNANESPKTLLKSLQRRLAQARFFTFSALLHVIIVVMAGSVVLIKNIVEPPDFVAEGGSLISAEAAAAAPPEELPKLDLQPLPPTTELATPALTALTSTATNHSFAMNAAAVPNVAGKNLASLAKKAGELGQGMSPGAAMAKGGTAMRFFGMQAKANSMVVVVDVSGSMVSGEKSVKTYEVLEREIGKLIKDLGDLNLFGLVAFSRDAEPYKPELTRATREEKERAYNWLKKLSPGVYKDPRASEDEKAFHRGTRADLGLKRAFEMKPDVIFFVSDGEPTGARPPEILKQVEAAQANLPTRVVVHTIAYLADSGQQFMRDLAQKNGGNFREVNPKDVR